MSPPVVRPLWTRLLSVTADAETLKSLTIEQAIKHAEVVRSMQHIEQAERHCEVLCFEEVVNQPSSLDV